MGSKPFVCLMYHDLGPGVVAGRLDPGHLSYVVSGTQFGRQLNYLRMAGWKGCNVSKALQGLEHAVAITFDDGTSTDIEVAAPALSYAGFCATFYVVTSRVGTPGYLSRQDLRSLVRTGFEIGSHSVSHAYLPSLSVEALRRELEDSKDQLEQWLGMPILHISCPLGGYTPTVAFVAKEVGYVSVGTSRVGVNAPGSAVLNRIVLRRNTSLDSFGRMCAGKSLLYPRARQLVLAGLKSTIGYPAYSLLASWMPRRKTPENPRGEPANPLPQKQ